MTDARWKYQRQIDKLVRDKLLDIVSEARYDEMERERLTIERRNEARALRSNLQNALTRASAFLNVSEHLHSAELLAKLKAATDA